MLCIDMDEVLEKAKAKGADGIPEIAKKSGLSEGTLYRVAARNAEPSLATVWGLAVFLDVPIESFLVDDPLATKRPVIPRQPRPGISKNARRRSAT